MKMHNESINPISQMLQSIATLEATIQAKESTYLPLEFLALEPVSQEQKQDSTIQNLGSGLRDCDASEREIPDLSLSKIPQDYWNPIAEWEQSSKAYPKAGICVNGKLSPLPCLEAPKREKGCSSLPIPTLTTGLGSGRNAGATRLEKWLRDNQFLQSTQALSVEMMSVLFGFPMDWALCLLESQKAIAEGLQQELCLEEQLISTVPPSQLSESSICIEFSANSIDARSSANSNTSIALDQDLDFLLKEAQRLKQLGAAPQGISLCCGKVRDRDFYQVQWRSRVEHPWLGNQKSKYVGVVDSKEHLSAIAIHRAGQQLVKVEKQIKKLQEKQS